MPGTPNDGKRADVLVAGATLYLLNDRGFNRWSAQVQPGQDDDGKRVTDEECAAVARALASIQRNREPEGLNEDRTPQDYVIEHAECMAVRAERLLDAVQEHAAAHLAREDDGNDPDSDEDISSLNDRCDRADEGVTEAMAKMRDGIQEFRKRRERAAIAAHASAPAVELTSMSEGFEAITTVLDYLLGEERAHAQTDWKGDTKASLVSALEIADVRRNLLEQIKRRIVGASATGDPYALTASGRARIDSAAEALSKVMAFAPLGDMASTVERALSGLRSMQALATPNVVESQLAAHMGRVLVPAEPTQEQMKATMTNDKGGLVTPAYRRAIYLAMLDAAPTPQVPVAAELTSIRMWHDRIKDEHPTSDPKYWTSSLKAQYMEAEILELRAELQAAGAKAVP